MLLGILSDTHGNVAAASAAVALLRSRGAERLLHCGDVGCGGVLDLLACLPAGFVFGNCDIDRAGLARYAAALGLECYGEAGEIETDGKRIAITHGHNPRLVRAILDGQRHDYLLVGHSHIQADQQVGKVRVINPGALHRAARLTVALLEPAANRLEFHAIGHLSPAPPRVASGGAPGVVESLP